MALPAPSTLLPLLAHRGLQRVRRWRDENGGWSRAAREAELWGTRWAGSHLSLAAWLDRPGAGRLWVDHRAGPRWARQTTSDREVAQADEVLAGRIPRIGAEPVTGHPPAWLRDGYSGRDWPIEPASRLSLMRGDGSDIRTVWELNRCYHFLALARAHCRTGNAAYTAAFRGHVESWIAANPPGLGPNWVSPMDAAIRAANWATAAVLLANAPGLSPTFWGAFLANLRLTARYVERNLEWHPVFRGNHYVSNAVGLVYLGALFRAEPEGQRWLRRGARILEAEIQYQVHPDGSSFEGSIGYHRLVTEFFAFGARVGRHNLEGFPSPAYLDRLEAMLEFLEAPLDVHGRAPVMGDADDGRLHHLCAAARDFPRLHRLGLPPHRRPPGRSPRREYPDGGWYVLGSGTDRCVVRCGPVGLRGAGSHDHNDQLSFNLVLDGQEVVTDSGTYAYTRDLEARWEFRATAAHNVPQLGGEEQNPIRADRPWRILADRTRARCLEWREGPGGMVFEGVHRGFAHRPSGAECIRRIECSDDDGRWTLRDRVQGQGMEQVEWRLHFAPGVVELEQVAPGGWRLLHQAVPSRPMTLEAPAAMEAFLEESRCSAAYGEYILRPVLVLRGMVALPIEIEWQVGRGARATTSAERDRGGAAG